MKKATALTIALLLALALPTLAIADSVDADQSVDGSVEQPTGSTIDPDDLLAPGMKEELQRRDLYERFLEWVANLPSYVIRR